MTAVELQDTDNGQPALPFGRFFGEAVAWWLAIGLPMSFVSKAVYIYAHEFAHGWTALALGGEFIGVRFNSALDRPESIAWSTDHQELVLSAGISVNVLLGSLFAWLSVRSTQPVLSVVWYLLSFRLLLDVAYVAEGCMNVDAGVADTALLLTGVESAAVRGWCALLSVLVAMVVTAALVRRQLRLWEGILGELTFARSLCVLTLLGNPFWMVMLVWTWPLWIAVALTVAAAVWWARRGRTPTSARVTEGAFKLGCFPIWLLGWTAANMSMMAAEGLPIRPASIIWATDIQPTRIAGIRHLESLAKVSYDTDDDTDGIRLQVQVFLADAETSRWFDIPDPDPLHVFWVPEPSRLVVVTADEILQVDVATREVESLWRPVDGVFENAAHGPRGTLAVTTRVERELADRCGGPLHLFDLARGERTLVPNRKTLGLPVFSQTETQPTVTVSAWTNLLTVAWGGPLEPGEHVITREPGASQTGWFVGVSGERRWFERGRDFFCGATTVSGATTTLMGVGLRGLYTLDESGDWTLTTPAGERSGGHLGHCSSVLGLVAGEPWVVMPGGELRPLEDPGDTVQLVLPERRAQP